MRTDRCSGRHEMSVPGGLDRSHLEADPHVNGQAGVKTSPSLAVDKKDKRDDYSPCDLYKMTKL